MSLLAELVHDLRYRYRSIRVPNLPLGLGVLQQRTARLGGHADYWWRFADDSSWLRVSAASLGRLPYCRTREQVAALLEATP